MEDDLTARYLTHLRTERRLAGRTLALYGQALSDLLGFARDAGRAPIEVQGHDIRRWAAALHGRGIVPASIARTLSVWRGLYRWLGREGLVERNPVDGVRAPRAAKPLPKALSVGQAVQLAELAGDTTADPALEARDRAIVELLYGSGLRISELVGLDTAAHAGARGWIDLDAAEVHVLGKGGKRRMVPLGRAALSALREWLGRRGALLRQASPALFLSRRGGRLTDQQIRQRLKERALRAGIPTGVHPHMLRHSFASHVLQSSGDLRAVQELLGHANIGTTQVYTRLDFQHLAKVYDAAHPRARKTR